MERHDSSLFNEEKHQSVVITGLNSYAVQSLLEVIRIIWPLNTELIKGQGVHFFNESLAPWIIPGMIKKRDAIASSSRSDTHRFHSFNQGLHYELGSGA
jgi:hypothetical protein